MEERTISTPPERGGARVVGAKKMDVCPTVRLLRASRWCALLLTKSISNWLKFMLLRLGLASRRWMEIENRAFERRGNSSLEY